MIQSNIILTKTFVDEDKLSKLIALSFFNHKVILPLKLDVDVESLEENWIHYTSLKQILNADFEDKDDFKASLLDIYQNYELPTLLFLGNLNKYSLPLQEGMLRLLEEPPANLHIVLFAHAKNEILPTITSRSRFLNIDRNSIMRLLNQDLLEKVKKKLPPVGDFAKNLVTTESFQLPDLSKVEREEIDFWLWQISCYLDQYFTTKPNIKVAKILTKVLESQKLNADNLQKKFAVGWLKTI